MSNDLYEKFSVKLKEERREIEAELEKAAKPISNRKKIIELGLEMGVSICESWGLGDFREKCRVQALMFPEGVIFDREKGGANPKS